MVSRSARIAFGDRASSWDILSNIIAALIKTDLVLHEGRGRLTLISACCAVQTALSVMAGLVPAIHAASIPANPNLFQRLGDVAECACIRLR